MLALARDASKLRHQQQLSEQLQQALESRIVIQQAKGITATQHGITLAQAYQRIRNTLVEELGLDPAAELQKLHQLMLAADPELDAPAAGPMVVRATTGRPQAVTPAQLPAEIPDFVGRTRELATFERMLPNGQGLRVVNLVGRPGIGKSTFAIHAAWAVRDRFPDGLLYADLSGQRTTHDVLAG